MPAAITDKLLKVGQRGTKTELAAPGKGPSDTSITLVNPANWQTDTAIVFSLYLEDPQTHLEVNGTYTVWKGVVVGSQVLSLQQLSGPTGLTYPAGAKAVMHISADWANMLIDTLLLTHDQSGLLKSGLILDSPSITSPVIASPPANISRLVGEMVVYPMRFAPSGWLLCDGAAVSRTTYNTLFEALNPSIGTVTVTIASPGVVTFNSHGLVTGDGVYLTTAGSLPTGIAQNTQYWVIKKDDNSFWLASSPANAEAGTKINTTGSQSGVHSMRFCPYGVGDGSTTFNVPDVREKVIAGRDASSTEFRALGKSVGSKFLQEHDHLVAVGGGSAGVIEWSRPNGPTGRGFPASSGTTANTSSGYTNTSGTGNSGNIQPSVAFNLIIKT